MIIAMFAIDDCGGMGFDGSMPWPRNKEDMLWFKKNTDRQIVVMGRKTWDSKDMPIPLPNRVNVLVTNDFIERDDIMQLKGDVCEGLLSVQNTYPDKDVFVIGGPNVLMQAIPVLEKAYITRIPGEYYNDVTINTNEFLKRFHIVDSTQLETCKIEKYEAIPRST
jgi:dihydrofolate reductase